MPGLMCFGEFVNRGNERIETKVKVLKGINNLSSPVNSLLFWISFQTVKTTAHVFYLLVLKELVLLVSSTKQLMFYLKNFK